MSRNKKGASYRQCKMQRRTGTGVTTYTAWIPEQLAVVGKYVEIEDVTWLITFASSETQTYEHLNSIQQTKKMFPSIEGK